MLRHFYFPSKAGGVKESWAGANLCRPDPRFCKLSEIQNEINRASLVGEVSRAANASRTLSHIVEPAETVRI